MRTDATLRPGDIAWIVLVAGVVLYEVCSPEDELLSDAADRYMYRRPWVTRLVVSSVALHLTNHLPDRVDPLHLIARLEGLIAKGRVRP